jgi:predicted nucleic-acid-binding protein
MIGLDTNVLVRYLVGDDAQQVKAVDKLVAEARKQDEPFYVDTIVLCETVWVLKSSYGFSRQQIHEALEQITSFFPGWRCRPSAFSVQVVSRIQG